jgi:hypothetical protein
MSSGRRVRGVTRVGPQHSKFDALMSHEGIAEN